MANADSKRKPSEGPRVSGTAYDMGLVLLALGFVAFVLVDVGGLAEGDYDPVVFVYAAFAALFAYLLYHFNRKRPRRTGLDFNL